MSKTDSKDDTPRMVLVEGFPRYSITDDGRVFSHYRNRWLNPTVGSTGYHHVQLSNNGVLKRFSVHRLVALHFIPPNGEHRLHINHIDSNRINNHYTNLEWCTQKENTAHMIKQGRHYTGKGGTHRGNRLISCRNGHLRTPENTYLARNGDRYCFICARKRDNERNRKKREALVNSKQSKED